MITAEGSDSARRIKDGGKTPVSSGSAEVLGRFISRMRMQPVAPSGQMPRLTPERAVSTAIGRAAMSACGLPIYPSKAQLAQATLAELEEILPERGLIVVVESAAGGLGVVSLCPAMLASVIEMQSVGRVSPHPPRERRATRTDASICGEFINAVLAELAAELPAYADYNEFQTFRLASFVDDCKPLELMLDDTSYRSIRMDMRAGQGGQREAWLIAILPDPHASPRVATSRQKDGEPMPAAVRRSLAAAVSTAPIQIEAVLCRRYISLRELRGVGVGSIVSLPRDAMGAARLETSGGLLLATGKLGELHGNRAIRLLPKNGTSSEVSADKQAIADSATGGFPDASDASGHKAHPDNIFGTFEHGADVVEPPLSDAAAPDPFRVARSTILDEHDDDANFPMSIMVE